MSTPTQTALAMVLLGAGCITNPQPEPLPVRSELVYVSDTIGLGESYVAGVQGAVEPSHAEAEVRNTVTGVSEMAPVQVDGSFLLRIGWGVGQPLEVRSWRGEQASEWRSVQVARSSASVIPTTIDALSWTGDRTAVVVSGTTGARTTVVVANVDQGLAVSTTAEPSGAYAATVGAQAGDSLFVFVVDEVSREYGGGSALAVVPPP
jgi:hypothetical protein